MRGSKRGNIGFLLALMGVLVFVVALSACNDPKMVMPPRSQWTEGVEPAPSSDRILVDPSTVELYPKERLQLVVKRGATAVAARFKSADSTILAVDGEGRVRYVKEGKTEIIVFVDKDSVMVASAALPVPEFKLPTPYLRFYDGREAIIPHERKQGHTLISDDRDLDVITFKTSRAEAYYFPKVGYSLRKGVQIYPADSIYLEDPRLLEQMERLGYPVDETLTQQYRQYAQYGGSNKFYEKFTQFKSEKANVYMVNYPSAYPVHGIVFNPKPLAPVAIELPLLEWGATPEQVKTFETTRGYEFKVRANVEGIEGRTIEIYSKKTELEDFTQLWAPRYVFEQGKLIGVTLLLHPLEYYLTSNGPNAFDFVSENLPKLKEQFPKDRKAAENSKLKIFYNEEKRQKVYFEQWFISVNESSSIAAGLVFLPYDGPDQLDLENKEGRGK